MNTALYTRFSLRLYHACLKYNPNFISVVFSVSVNLRMQLSAHVARSHRRPHHPSTSSAPSVSSARSPLTSFTLAYESDQPPTHVCYIIRPVSRHIVHSSLLHRLRCPSPSASSALFVVHIVHPLRPLSSSSIYFICPICSACSHRPFPCTFMITSHSADTFLPGQPVTTAVPKIQHIDNVHLALFQKCPISDTCPFSNTFGRTLPNTS